MISLISSVICTLLALVHAVLVVPRLPEPSETEVGAEVLAVKPRYCDLRTPGFVGTTCLVAGVAGVACTAAPRWCLPLWWVWGGSVTTLVGVDVRTTFLPRRLWFGCVGQAALGTLVAAGIVAPGVHDLLLMLLFMALGAVGAALPFWLLWRFGGSLGYGDVRLAAGMGAAAASLGVDAVMTSLLGATLVGAVMSVGVTWWRRRHPSVWGAAIAYGPALWIGPWIGLLTTRV